MHKLLFSLMMIIAICYGQLSFGTTFVPISIKKQLQESDAIVEGIVAFSETVEHEGKILTKVSINLDRWIGVSPEDNQVDVFYPGGELNGKHVIVHGAPELNLGENVILFLKKKNDGELWMNNLGLGKFSIKRVGTRKVMVNQIFPGYPAVGQMDLERFVDLSTWVKKTSFTVRFKDKYEVNHDKTVKQYIKNQGRSLASLNANTNENHVEEFPIYWLVFLLGCLGVLFRLAKNKLS